MLSSWRHSGGILPGRGSVCLDVWVLFFFLVTTCKSDAAGEVSMFLPYSETEHFSGKRKHGRNLGGLPDTLVFSMLKKKTQNFRPVV